MQGWKAEKWRLTKDEGERVQCVRRMQQGDGGLSEKNGGRKEESPELYFVTRRDAKITVEVSTRL